MTQQQQQQQPYRRVTAYTSQFTTSQIHLRNPWVVAFFSFSYPGFGQLLLQRYLKAFVLIGWEVFINNLAKINLGIFYSLLGQFDKAKDVLDERWLMLYVGIYFYSIWDSYRLTVDLNKQYILADRENAPLTPFVMTAWDINYFDKRNPLVALAWSVFVPGIGQLYVHKVLTGFFIFGYTVLILYFSHIPQSIQFSATGEFLKAKEILNMQWALFIPSIYIFIIYDAYSSAVEYNKLFEKELANYLKQKYRSPKFKFPV